MPEELAVVLAESRRRGLIGPTAFDEQVLHSRGFSEFVEQGARVMDLGSGGGLPGLVLAVGREDLSLVLLDASARRTRFLEWSVQRLELTERTSVEHGRAEDVARLETMSEQFDAVVSRSFGPPAVTAECARPFMRPGGLLVVSEPPDSEPAKHTRWPQDALGTLGLELVGADTRWGHGFSVMAATGPCPQGFPRRSGVAAKRPLF